MKNLCINLIDIFHFKKYISINLLAVNRNVARFPDDFMFQVTKEEFDNLISQFGTSSWGGRRKLPYAFTEKGVAMLSGVLHSERAITVNIQIMRVFTKIHEILPDNLSVRLEIEEIKKQLVNHDKNVELVFSYLDELMEKQRIRLKLKRGRW